MKVQELIDRLEKFDKTAEIELMVVKDNIIHYDSCDLVDYSQSNDEIVILRNDES